MTEQAAKKRESRMPIRHAEGRDPFFALRERMDRLMDEFFGGHDVLPSSWAVRPFEWRMAAFRPSVDIRDEDNQLKIEAELPGLSDKDVEITLSGDALVIREKRSRRRSRRKRTTIAWSAPAVPSSTRSPCQSMSTGRRWRPTSRMAC